MKNLTIIAGARPNFMKIAPLIHQIQKKQREESSSSLNLNFSFCILRIPL